MSDAADYGLSAEQAAALDAVVPDWRDMPLHEVHALVVCSVPGCAGPGGWVFKADGPAEAFEVLVGLLVEPGDTIRLCDPHAAMLRAEVEARPDGRVNAWSD